MKETIHPDGMENQGGHERRINHYFQIDEESVHIDPVHPGNPDATRFYRMESRPIDGRTSGDIGPDIMSGPAYKLQFEVRNDLPGEGLFEYTRESVEPGGNSVKKIYASSDEVLQAFLEKHNLSKE